jgi:hypothetical protein
LQSYLDFFFIFISIIYCLLLLLLLLLSYTKYFLLGDGFLFWPFSVLFLLQFMRIIIFLFPLNSLHLIRFLYSTVCVLLFSLFFVSSSFSFRLFFFSRFSFFSLSPSHSVLSLSLSPLTPFMSLSHTTLSIMQSEAFKNYYKISKKKSSSIRGKDFCFCFLLGLVSLYYIILYYLSSPSHFSHEFTHKLLELRVPPSLFYFFLLFSKFPIYF